MHAVVSAVIERKLLWLLAVVPVLLVLASRLHDRRACSSCSPYSPSFRSPHC